MRDHLVDRVAWHTVVLKLVVQLDLHVGRIRNIGYSFLFSLIIIICMINFL